jgi:hypothetical protein
MRLAVGDHRPLGPPGHRRRQLVVAPERLDDRSGVLVEEAARRLAVRPRLPRPGPVAERLDQPVPVRDREVVGQRRRLRRRGMEDGQPVDHRQAFLPRRVRAPLARLAVHPGVQGHGEPLAHRLEHGAGPRASRRDDEVEAGVAQGAGDRHGHLQPPPRDVERLGPVPPPPGEVVDGDEPVTVVGPHPPVVAAEPHRRELDVADHEPPAGAERIDDVGLLDVLRSHPHGDTVRSPSAAFPRVPAGGRVRATGPRCGGPRRSGS